MWKQKNTEENSKKHKNLTFCIEKVFHAPMYGYGGVGMIVHNQPRHKSLFHAHGGKGKPRIFFMYWQDFGSINHDVPISYLILVLRYLSAPYISSISRILEVVAI